LTDSPDLDITVIVPAYNEVARIGATIAEIHGYFTRRGLSYEIIVSADGDDGTRETVHRLAETQPNLVAIGHKVRGGKGRGVREAMALARGRVVGFVDADQKTPIEEYDKVAAELQAGYDLVIGSRGLAASEIERPQPWHRRLGSRGFGLFMHTVVGLHGIPDTQCGFKFFRHDVGRDLFARQQIDGYMFDVEILYLAVGSGYRLAQVPVRWRDDGDSRLQLVAGNLRNAADIFRIRFRNNLRGTSSPRRH
jgi:glycosyltransferase involved in cell wall biosynthesis